MVSINERLVLAIVAAVLLSTACAQGAGMLESGLNSMTSFGQSVLGRVNSLGTSLLSRVPGFSTANITETVIKGLRGTPQAAADAGKRALNLVRGSANRSTVANQNSRTNSIQMSPLEKASGSAAGPKATPATSSNAANNKNQ